MGKKETVYGYSAQELKELEQLHQILVDKGIAPKDLKSWLEIERMKKAKVKVNEPRQTSTFTFGIVSDTHLVSKKCAINELHQFYAHAKKRGIRHIVHAGDFLDGDGTVYRGQLSELVCFGVDDHVKYAVENYPRLADVQTYVIGGN